MAKAEGFTSVLIFPFMWRLRSLGKRHRMPPLLRRRAIDATAGNVFHYDPLANRVQRSITNGHRVWTGHRVQGGNLSVSRATRALKFLAELGLITYQTEYDPQIGCNIPTDITFTPALFSALDVSEVAVVAARRSRVEWENLQRKSRN
jgi:incFII family plasmid replication initiator RepA